jgi:alpha-beta hydrolase superfamily lysophospholipase
VKKKGESQIFLFGTSLGAVAIMKCLHESSEQPTGIILECPFGTMYEAVSARFENMKVPTFPMAALLTFWGGAQNGFWPFDHNPIRYAKSISCPTLLLYGEADKKVSRKEIDHIFSNLQGRKRLETYALAGHENYLTRYRQEWTADVAKFLEEKK